MTELLHHRPDTLAELGVGDFLFYCEIYPGFGFVDHLDPFITNLQDTGSLLIGFRFAGHLYHRLKHFIIWRRGATNTDIDSLLGEIVNFRNFYLSEIDCIHSRENLF